jgi:ribonuclease HI
MYILFSMKTRFEMAWVVYTDGASKGNPGYASWGVVVVDPTTLEFEKSAYIGVATNQVAELTAALEGLKCVPSGESLTLVSDSQYVLKGISEWRKGWERNGMKNSKGEQVANLALWKAVFFEVDKRNVKTQWVRGHNGHSYNERCDALANAAIAAAI